MILKILVGVTVNRNQPMKKKKDIGANVNLETTKGYEFLDRQILLSPRQDQLGSISCVHVISLLA